MTVRSLLELVSGATVVIYDKSCEEIGRMKIGSRCKDFDFTYSDYYIYMISHNDEFIEVYL